MASRNNHFSRGLMRITPLVFCTIVWAQSEGTGSTQLQPREPFPIALPKISVSVDDITKDFDGVRITFAESDDQVIIGTYNDLYIKFSSNGTDKILYRENPEKAGYLSKFESKYIMKVNKEFIATLEVFDKLLQRQSWGRCLYLDAYFPHFLSSYYYMICAARNSENALPRSALIQESEFDVSLNSPRSDARIAQWRLTTDYIIKLRIAAKELAHQLKEWQKILDKVKDDEDLIIPKEHVEAFIIFIRVYLNFKPPSPVVVKKSGY